MVYNTAAAHYLGLHKLTDAHWDKMCAALNPDQINLFATDAAPVDAPETQEKSDASPHETSATSYIKDSSPPPVIQTRPAPAPIPRLPPARNPRTGRSWAKKW